MYQVTVVHRAALQSNLTVEDLGERMIPTAELRVECVCCAECEAEAV